MPDVSPLPRVPDRPVFTPRAGDYEAVLAGATRRRRRDAAVLTAATSVVAAFAVLAGGGNPRAMRIEQVDEPSPPPTVHMISTPASPVRSGSPGPAPDPVSSYADRPRLPAGPFVTVRPTPRTSRSTVSPPALFDWPAVTRTDGMAYEPEGCGPDASVGASGWCFRAQITMADYSNVAEVPLGVYACRVPGSGAAALEFAGHEVDFDITDAEGDRVWRWSSRAPARPAPSSLRIADGACSLWTFTWPATDENGVRVFAGTYTMRAAILAAAAELVGTGPDGATGSAMLTEIRFAY